MNKYKHNPKKLKKKNATKEAELEKRRQQWRDLYRKTNIANKDNRP